MGERTHVVVVSPGLGTGPRDTKHWKERLPSVALLRDLWTPETSLGSLASVGSPPLLLPSRSSTLHYSLQKEPGVSVSASAVLVCGQRCRVDTGRWLAPLSPSKLFVFRGSAWYF